MANFFSGLWKAATHPVDELDWWKDVATGETSLKDAPGAHQRMMNDITVPILGDNKLSKNSDAVAGVIVGGAMAAGAGGGAGGAAGGSGSGGGIGAGSGGSNVFGQGLGAEGATWWQQMGNSASNIFGPSDEALGALADAETAAETGNLMSGYNGAQNAGLGKGSDALSSLGYGSNMRWDQLGDVGKYLGQSTKQNAPSHNMPRFNPRFSMPEDNSMQKQMVNAAMSQAANQAMSNPWQPK